MQIKPTNIDLMSLIAPGGASGFVRDQFSDLLKSTSVSSPARFTLPSAPAKIKETLTPRAEKTLSPSRPDAPKSEEQKATDVSNELEDNQEFKTAQKQAEPKPVYNKKEEDQSEKAETAEAADFSITALVAAVQSQPVVAAGETFLPTAQSAAAAVKTEAKIGNIPAMPALPLITGDLVIAAASPNSLDPLLDDGKAPVDTLLAQANKEALALLKQGVQEQVMPQAQIIAAAAPQKDNKPAFAAQLPGEQTFSSLSVNEDETSSSADQKILEKLASAVQNKEGKDNLAKAGFTLAQSAEDKSSVNVQFTGQGINLPAQSAAINSTIAAAARNPHLPAATEQVAVHIVKAVKEGVDRIRINLNPEDLGRVEVRLDLHKDGSVKAVISADKPETYQWLQHDAKSLERALQDAGLKTDSNQLSFNLRQDNLAHRFQDAHDQQSGSSGKYAGANGITAAEEQATAYNLHLSNNERLDIRV
ncbi:MAG: flagellar hook-length control protein FliK [Dongiaceae bacterium]